jgi:hypothetical protein
MCQLGYCHFYFNFFLICNVSLILIILISSFFITCVVLFKMSSLALLSLILHSK